MHRCARFWACYWAGHDCGIRRGAVADSGSGADRGPRRRQSHPFMTRASSTASAMSACVTTKTPSISSWRAAWRLAWLPPPTSWNSMPTAMHSTRRAGPFILSDLFTARSTRSIPRSRGRAQPLAGGDPVRGGPASSFGRDCFVSQCAPRNDTPNLAEVAEISAGQGLSYKFVLEAPSFSTHLLARLGSYRGCSLASHQ